MHGDGDGGCCTILAVVKNDKTGFKFLFLEYSVTMGLFAEVKTWWISHLLLFYIVLMSGLIVNFLMLLTFIFVWPFNKALYRKIVVHLGYAWWSRTYAFVGTFTLWKCIYLLKCLIFLSNFNIVFNLVIHMIDCKYFKH